MQRRVHSQEPTYSHKQAMQCPHHMIILMGMSHLQTFRELFRWMAEHIPALRKSFE